MPNPQKRHCEGSSVKGNFQVCAALVVALLFISTADSRAQKKKEAIAWPAGEVKWSEMKGGPPGIMYAELWGHMDKGAYGSLVKLPAGVKHPLHTHSSDTKLVVISGTFLFTPEVGTEQRLGPGSYLMVPGGVKHLSGVTEDGPCEVFQEGPGKFDFHPADAGMK
jgi:anti-sigma factor ChrR (cupin superfamily)